VPNLGVPKLKSQEQSKEAGCHNVRRSIWKFLGDEIASRKIKWKLTVGGGGPYQCASSTHLWMELITAGQARCSARIGKEGSDRDAVPRPNRDSPSDEKKHREGKLKIGPAGCNLGSGPKVKEEE